MLDGLFKVLTEEEKIQEREKNLRDIQLSIEKERSNLLQFSNWHFTIANIFDVYSSLIKTIPSYVLDATPLLVLNSYNSNEFSEKEKTDLNNEILKSLPDYFKDKPLFLRNGTFSNKFDFSTPSMGMSRDFVDSFSNISHIGLTFGAGFPSEIVVREFIDDVENNPTIYSGMPLRTEFRFFYDFDTGEVLGVSNYWNREVMIENLLSKVVGSKFMKDVNIEEINVLLKGIEEIKSKNQLQGYQLESLNDLKSYLSVVDKIESEYEIFKHVIKDELERVLIHNSELKGKWSVDIMKNGEDFFFIDMALMERSALLDEMEVI